jgi:hypothetical protein
MSKNYGLTTRPNEGVKDKAPDWMEEFFKKDIKKEKKEHPFAGVDDPILNPQRIGLEDKK